MEDKPVFLPTVISRKRTMLQAPSIPSMRKKADKKNWHHVCIFATTSQSQFVPFPQSSAIKFIPRGHWWISLVGGRENTQMVCEKLSEFWVMNICSQTLIAGHNRVIACIDSQGYDNMYKTCRRSSQPITHDRYRSSQSLESYLRSHRWYMWREHKFSSEMQQLKGWPILL